MIAKMFVDGSSFGNPGPAGIGVIIVTNSIEEMSIPIGIATNNEAEYRALLSGLQKALDMGIRQIEAFIDSEVVAQQIKQVYKIKNPKLMTLYKKIIELTKNFEVFQINYITREQNSKADQLAKQAAGRSAMFSKNALLTSLSSNRIQDTALSRRK